MEATSGSVKHIKQLKDPNAVSLKSNFAINTFFWLYSLGCVIPLILVVIVSFTDEKTAAVNGFSFFPDKFSLGAYEYLFKDWQQIVRSTGISAFVTLGGTALSLLIMGLYAYPISRNDFPHKNFFSFFMFFTMLFNGGLVPWYLVYTQMLDLKNTLWALMMPLLVSAFYVLLLRTFFATTIPPALIEAAKIDGAHEFRVFAQIVIPLSLPVLATVGLFQTLNYWNDWFLSLVYITGDKNVNLQFLMYKTLLDVQFLSSNVNAATSAAQSGAFLKVPTQTVSMATAILGIGPIVFAYPFFQRFLIKGLTVGAVKG